MTKRGWQMARMLMVEDEWSSVGVRKGAVCRVLSEPNARVTVQEEPQKHAAVSEVMFQLTV
jgi:hypothetical protein